MRNATIILLSAVSGFVGGLASSHMTSNEPKPPEPTSAHYSSVVANRIEIRDENTREYKCELTSTGIVFKREISADEVQKAEITPVSFSIEVPGHRAVLGAMPWLSHPVQGFEGFDGSPYLLLDGKLLHPSKVNDVKLLMALSSVGEVDLHKIEP